MSRLWDSNLVDHLPQALASVAQRSLLILEVSDGVVRLAAVPPLPMLAEDVATLAEDVLPIVLARSFAEVGYDHYDLVS